MSRGSSLFTIGIFIVFLAVLFHYFCRSRKKPEMIVQQQVMPPPEGYVYPITPNNVTYPTQQPMNIGGSLYPSVHPPYPNPVPEQQNYIQHQYIYSPYGESNVGTGFPQVPSGHIQTNYSHPAQPLSHQQLSRPSDELPPPYHVAVGAGPVGINSHSHPI